MVPRLTWSVVGNPHSPSEYRVTLPSGANAIVQRVGETWKAVVHDGAGQRNAGTFATAIDAQEAVEADDIQRFWQLHSAKSELRELALKRLARRS